MAVTKIWTIHEGSKISEVLDYAANEEKTVYKLKVETEHEYGLLEEQQFQDFIDYAMENVEASGDFENVLSYAANGEKTEERKFVTGINCAAEHARDEMMLTKTHYHKEDGILLWHGYQSFKPGEVTPEEAHEIGIALANNMWGDDYEVLVCTHLDQEHIHNHFVVNSVSWRTGKKLDVRWKDMAQESDRLCAMYGKSIVENPKCKGMHYAQWQAVKENRPTWTTAIRQDIDEQITMSRSMQEFFSGLQKRGYRVKADAKYFTLKPPGKDRFVRIDRRLGESYSLFGIQARIEECVKNGNTRMPEEDKRRTYKVKGTVQRPKYKFTGYQALYIRYCYMLGTLPKRNVSAGKVHYLYREDLTKMHRITRETAFLCRNRIETLQDLNDEEYNIKQDLKRYRKEKEYVLSSSAEDKEERLESLNRMIKDKKYQLYLVRDIRENTGHMQEKAETVTREQEGGMKYAGRERRQY